MGQHDSALDPDAVAEARALLSAPPARSESPWPAVGAAALLAVSALVLAGAMIFSPLGPSQGQAPQAAEPWPSGEAAD